MDKQLISTRDTVGSNLLRRSNVGTLHLLARIFKRCSNEPAIFVLEHLVHTHLMLLATILEARVIDQIGTPILSGNDGVMTLGTLTETALGLITPVAIGSEDIHTTVVAGIRAEVETVSCKDGIRITGIQIGTIGFV